MSVKLAPFFKKGYLLTYAFKKIYHLYYLSDGRYFSSLDQS